MSVYDNHLFIKTLGNSGIISCVPNNEENYISSTKQVVVDKFLNKEEREVNVKRELTFIDSLRFMTASLDELSSNLKIDHFVNLKKYDSGNQLRLLLRKGIYRYDYVDSMRKLDDTSLPPKEAFILNSQMNVVQVKTTNISSKQTVWKEFNIESMKDYHNLDNLSDVLLLADIFENIMKICMNHYGLDPASYYSAPGLAWDAELKIAKVQHELLSNPDMLLMIESGIRGGIATISRRHAKANNEYMGTEFSLTNESKLISYLDANNIYGWAKSTSEFKLITDDELDN